MCNVVMFCCCFAAVIFILIKVTIFVVSYLFSDKTIIAPELISPDGTPTNTTISEPSKVWKAIEPYGAAILWFLLYLVIIIGFMLANFWLVYFMAYMQKEMRVDQINIIKMNSARNGKANIIFSKMTIGIILYYALLVLDIFLLLPYANQPTWLSYIMTPNMKIVILGQLAALLTVG